MGRVQYTLRLVRVHRSCVQEVLEVDIMKAYTGKGKFTKSVQTFINKAIDLKDQVEFSTFWQE